MGQSAVLISVKTRREVATIDGEKRYIVFVSVMSQQFGQNAEVEIEIQYAIAVAAPSEAVI